MEIFIKGVVFLSLIFFHLGLHSKKQAFIIDDSIMKAEYDLYRINSKTDPNSAEEYLENYFYMNDDKSNTGVSIDDKGDCRLDTDKLIYHLNKLREKHIAKKMKWSKELADRSYKYLQELNKKNEWAFKVFDTELEDVDWIEWKGPKRLTERELLQKWYQSYYELNPRKQNVDYKPMTLLVSRENNLIGCSKLCSHLNEMYLCFIQPKAIIISKLLDDLTPNIYMNTPRTPGNIE